MADTSKWKELTFSSGVMVRYGPFPGAMYWDIMARALEEHPDPEPPMKTIEVVDGTEEIEDLDNEEYLAALAKARYARLGIVGEAALEICVEIVDDDWEQVAQRLIDKWVEGPLPDDPLDRKVWFLSKYAIRTPQDWDIIGKVRRFSQIEDEEVRQRAEFFPSEVEGAEGVGPDAPGAGEQ